MNDSKYIVIVVGLWLERIVPSCCRTAWSPPLRHPCSRSPLSAFVSVSPFPSPDGAWPAGHNINTLAHANPHFQRHDAHYVHTDVYAKTDQSCGPINRFLVIIIMYTDCEYWQFLHTDTSAESTYISMLCVTGENSVHGQCASNNLLNISQLNTIKPVFL